jgi:hypothetical protein
MLAADVGRALLLGSIPDRLRIPPLLNVLARMSVGVTQQTRSPSKPVRLKFRRAHRTTNPQACAPTSASLCALTLTESRDLY